MALNKKIVKSCVESFALLGVVAAMAGCGHLGLNRASSESSQPQISEEQREAAQLAKEDQEIELMSAPPSAADVKPAAEAVNLSPKTPDAIPVASPSPAKPALVIPKEPNTVLISVDSKDKSHPEFGEGHPNGFLVNGVMGDDIIVRRGDKFTFRVDTDVKHDFYITTSAVGWGGSVYTTGVTGQFTYKGDVVLQTDESTPETLYYQCRNHKNMGGRIVIVDKNADVAAVKKRLLEERQKALAKNASGAGHSHVDEGKVKQKIAYAKMMLGIRGKQLDAAAKAAIEGKIKESDAALGKGNLDVAYSAAEAAADLLKTPGAAQAEKNNLVEAKKAYEEKLHSIDSIKESHQRAFSQAKKKGEKAVAFDQKRVDEMLSSATQLAKSEKYAEAKKELTRVEYLITTALNEMVGSRTVVFELKFDTPADEYEYEKKRYFSYIELIPTAIEMRKPEQSRIDAAQQFVDKAKFYAQKADESMAAGRVDEAIVVIKDATSELRVALMRLGVSM
ncbi:MAG: hypothetical protein OEW58_07780 [Gammaproteobacteria bacterium]|nr:hypothetical protein [Gammaproteobacteria bacterium]